MRTRRGGSPDGVALVLAVAADCGVQARPAGPGEVQFLTPVTGVASVRRLERRLARHPAEQWPAMVREHVSWLVADASVYRPAHARDWDEIRPLLRARLRPVGTARPDRLPSYVLRHAGIALGEVLAVVADGDVTTVSRLAVPRWGVPIDVALEAGRDNVRRAGGLERRWDGPWLVLTGDQFTSAHVWWAGNEVPGDAGMLVALPAATTILIAGAEGKGGWTASWPSSPNMFAGATTQRRTSCPPTYTGSCPGGCAWLVASAPTAGSTCRTVLADACLWVMRPGPKQRGHAAPWRPARSPERPNSWCAEWPTHWVTRAEDPGVLRAKGDDHNGRTSPQGTSFRANL